MYVRRSIPLAGKEEAECERAGAEGDKGAAAEAHHVERYRPARTLTIEHGRTPERGARLRDRYGQRMLDEHTFLAATEDAAARLP